ncbi:nuclear transport factor 2 family protein [Amycolatopsis acidicola]|uniref:Nuclear transport factor 2 family protein n=1 Tax=Amycolatopsis acidicola TaxID=2596893 RepID=A0A5N0UWS9_9PSEU|nr:nuclear transport factor 2 family protein [Amycolatopsis acidicola]KAA9156570.1 nuclear transport factor 2 family protein [Amycolatopsis acidicola]
MTTHDTGLFNRALAVVDAWNRFDYDALRELVHENVTVVHQNRGVGAQGRDKMFETIDAMGQAFPDRSIGETTRWAVSGRTVFRETVWQGTAAVDVPGFGKAGEQCRLDVASLMTFDEAGKLTEWCDYG